MRKPQTKLERHVAKWLRETGRNYGDGPQGAYRDLMAGGCQAGTVGHLVYYTDTTRFYRRHMIEVDVLLAAACADSGCGPAALFGDQWEVADPLARDTFNQNLLAWFGFEEVARYLMEDKS
jgi:hypothetical protein